MILYRGTPYEEDWPESHDYGAIFMTDSAGHACMYGRYVQVYEVGKPKLLNLDSKSGLKVTQEYRQFQPRAWDHRGRPREILPLPDESRELAIHPQQDWLDYVADLGYDGYRQEGYSIVGLFDSDRNRRRFKLRDCMEIDCT